MDTLESVSMIYLTCAIAKYLEDETVYNVQDLDKLLDDAENILNQIYEYVGPSVETLSAIPQASRYKEFLSKKAKPVQSSLLKYLNRVNIDQTNVIQKPTFVAGNCFTVQFLTLLLQMFQKFMTQFYTLETNFTMQRFNNQLKTIFLLFQTGGKTAIHAYLQFTDSLCTSTPNKFVTGLQKGRDFACVKVFTEEMREAQLDVPEVLIGSVTLNTNKFLEHFRIPKSALPRNFLLNCNSPLLMEMKNNHLLLFHDCDENMMKSFCGTKSLCSRISLTPSHLTKEFHTVMSTYMQRFMDDLTVNVSKFLKKNLSPPNVDVEQCPLFTPDYLTNPADFNEQNYAGQITSHFEILEKLKSLEPCDIDNNLVDNLQASMKSLLLDWASFSISDKKYAKTACLMRQLLKSYKDDFLRLSLLDQDRAFESLNVELPTITNELVGELLSSETLQGFVWKLKLKKYASEDLVLAIMKYDKLYMREGLPVEKTANLLHEIVVGLALNKLKGIVENFMYSFGGFICSPPEDGKTFKTLCNNRDKRNMRIIELTEFIPNIGSFADVLDSNILTKHDILKIMLQVAYALMQAQKLFNKNFIHGDLHAGNVLIVQLDSSKRIELQFETETKEFYTTFVPVIIDYGFSIVEVEKKLLLPFLKNEISFGTEKDINRQFAIFQDLVSRYTNIYRQQGYDVQLTKENFDLARLLFNLENGSGEFTLYPKLLGVNCLETIFNLYDNLAFPNDDPLEVPTDSLVQKIGETNITSFPSDPFYESPNSPLVIDVLGE